MKTMECPTCNESWEAGMDGRCSSCGGSERIAESGSDAPTCSAYVVRVTRLSVLPPKEPLFSEQCTHITIEDEAAGEYLEIEQQSGSPDAKHQTIIVTPEEWPAIKQAVETLLSEIDGQNVRPLAPADTQTPKQNGNL